MAGKKKTEKIENVRRENVAKRKPSLTQVSNFIISEPLLTQVGNYIGNLSVPKVSYNEVTALLQALSRCQVLKEKSDGN